LSWLLLGLLGIIWAAFLLPSRKRSPASSVEEFERKMSLLAEANSSSPGRWVLMPRKGARLVGSQDRERFRARRRRRQIFMVLLETMALTLLMGLFPPFRVMLYGTGVLAFVLLAYSALLVKIREEELAKARLRMAMDRQQAYQPVAPVRTRVPAAASVGSRASVRGNGNGHANGNGNGNGHSNGVDFAAARADANRHGHGNGNGHAYAYGNGNGNGPANGYLNGNGNGHANGYSNGNGNGHANGNGHSNGNGQVDGNRSGALADYLREGGVEMIDDDIHIIVRPVAEFAADIARSSAR
jgi:hypothetical protein